MGERSGLILSGHYTGGMTLEKVTDRLFVSPYLTPQVLQEARSAGITDILNVAKELDDPSHVSRTEFRLLKIGLLDTGAPIPAPLLDQILKTCLHILSYPDKRLLIHCLRGHNRSPSAAYLVLRGFGLPPVLSKSLIPGGSAPRYSADVDRFLIQVKSK